MIYKYLDSLIGAVFELYHFAVLVILGYFAHDMTASVSSFEQIVRKQKRFVDDLIGIAYVKRIVREFVVGFVEDEVALLVEQTQRSK